jgi:hypothetical protein
VETQLQLINIIPYRRHPVHSSYLNSGLHSKPAVSCSNSENNIYKFLSPVRACFKEDGNDINQAKTADLSANILNFGAFNQIPFNVRKSVRYSMSENSLQPTCNSLKASHLKQEHSRYCVNKMASHHLIALYKL